MPSTRPEIAVRGDARAVGQLARSAEAGDAVRAALLADGHVGYSQPIGGVIAYPEHISPSGVGYDIGCGNKATRTDLTLGDIDVPRVMDKIAKRISFGIGRNEGERADHLVLDKIRRADFASQRKLY